MSRAFPAFLIVAGAFGAAYFAIEREVIEFAIACLVVAIGVHDWHATTVHQQDVERFKR